MTITIPTPERGSPALRALAMEGLDAVEWVCLEPTDYGSIFTTLWNLGRPFVICEHDIIPWPGAIAGLQACPEPWCTHAYPLHQGNITRSFGIGKYTPDGPAEETWAESPWYLLDGYVVPVLNRLYGGPHVHEPPVAHARKELAA